MTENILVTRPDHDDITSYLSYWTEDIIKFGEGKGFKISDFKGKKANRKDVENFLKKKKPVFTFFNGHGSDSKILGQNDETLIEEGENDDLPESIVYSLVCSSAKKLGRSCIQKNTKCYIGYDEEFAALLQITRIATPDKDKMAKAFSQPAMTIPKEILKGKTTGEAYNKSQQQFQKQIEYYSSSITPHGTQHFIPYLL